MLARPAILGLLILYASATAAAEPQKFMHRSQAGMAASDGWFTAKSTHGAFTVRVPYAFDDLSATDPDSGVTYHEVEAATEQVKFSARRGPVPGDSDTFLADIERKQPAKVIGSTRHKYKGHPALSLTAAVRKEKAFLRYVVVEGEIIVMLAVWADGTQASQDDAEKFFNSLKIGKQKT